jgi:acetylornithine deacetylase/succinyl-diaminopimelate desuccinylase-like protein
MSGVQAALRRATAQRFGTLRMLEELIRIPSISADPRYAPAVRRCAARLAGQLRRIGLERVQLVATPGSPLVYGEWCRRPGRPIVLVYGHYDVQPVDPLPAWRSPPFEPTYRGHYLYGRGASDDKGQLCAHLAAIDAWMQATGGLPVNLRCLLDGEEEVGSPHLTGFLEARREQLESDVVVISDTRMAGRCRPAVTVGLRGLLTAELEVRGPRADLHAGTFGGAVHNPAQALAELIAGLHGPDGRVAIAGFYDRVRGRSQAERAVLAAAAPPNATVLRRAGVRQGWGEPGWSAHERTTLRPAVTVNGVTGGYAGPGSKSVIPARATAKLGIRLVPDQRPAEVEQLLRRHVARVTPATVHTALRAGSRVPPAIFDTRSPVMAAVVRACLRGFGARPVPLSSGGTIPAAGMLQSRLRVPVVLLGLALPDDGAHAPNERFHIPTLWRGIDTLVWLHAELARIGATAPARDGGTRGGAELAALIDDLK